MKLNLAQIKGRTAFGSYVNGLFGSIPNFPLSENGIEENIKVRREWWREVILFIEGPGEPHGV